MFKINNKNLISFGIILSFIFALSLSVFMPISAKALYYEDWINGTYSGYNHNYFGNDYNYNGYNYNYYENNYNETINPIPYIYSSSPSVINKNTSSTLTINGNGFTRSSIVKLDDYNLNTTFINSSTLRAQINSYNSNLGEHYITVFNPAPGGGYSNAITFTVKNIANTNNTVSKNTSKNVSTTKSKSASVISDKSKEKLNETSDLAGNALFGTKGFMPSSVLQWIFFTILILLAIILWRKLYVSEGEKHTPLKHA